jgi:hypothetical protein
MTNVSRETMNDNLLWIKFVEMWDKEKIYTFHVERI